MQKWTVVIPLLAFAFPCRADECASIIALSRIQNTVVASQSEVESNAANFFDIYSHNRSSSNSSSFGASYDFLAATFASGSASVDEVASKYCSASNKYAASANAYHSYIESIAPGAYDAYEKCIAIKQNMSFDVDEGSVLPDQFAMSVSFTQPGNVSANLQASPSSDVTCSWNGRPAPRGQLPTISIRSPSTAALECDRTNVSKRSFVKIVRTNGDEFITIPWQEYTPEGVPVSLVDSLRREVSAAAKQAKDADSILTKINDPANLQIISTLIDGKGPLGLFDINQNERVVSAIDGHRFCAITTVQVSSGTCNLHQSGNNWVISTDHAARCGVTCFDVKFEIK
jgi:hypothetical protein